MTSNLNITKVEIRNFLCFGDYKTEVDLDRLGTVLIVGDRSNKTDVSTFRQSNGAGKSSITTAILWCLFGRTFNIANPGDKVVNWYVGKDCYVKIATSDGWEIIRTRKMKKRNELELYYNGETRTLSTPTNTQKLLNRTFGLDFDIFVSSIFFGQFSRPFLEIGDAKRKNALERLLNLNKLNIWANVAKEKVNKTEQALVRTTVIIKAHNDELGRLDEQLSNTKGDDEGFEVERTQKIQEVENLTRSEIEEKDSIEIPDIDALRTRWETIDKIDKKISQYKIKSGTLTTRIEQLKEIRSSNEKKIESQEKQPESALANIERLELEHRRWKSNEDEKRSIIEKLARLEPILMQKQANLNNKRSMITEWEEKSGQSCPYCKQRISPEHTKHICQPILNEVEPLVDEVRKFDEDVIQLRERLDQLPDTAKPTLIEEAIRFNTALETLQENVVILKNENTAIDSTIEELKLEIESIGRLVERVNEKAKSSTPTISLDKAMNLKTRKVVLEQSIASRSNQTSELISQESPYKKTIEKIESQISSVKEKISKIEKTQSQLDIFYDHLNYIRAIYTDRRKIKKFILNNLIPLLNTRIQYYLESFNCEFGIEFTPTLAVLPSKWDYGLCSGGERKRIDMAVMFALYDLHIYMYGRQCNIMVLDEIDGRLDTEGIESFIEVVMNDFTGTSGTRPRPDTIIIISHRPEMLDAFPSKMLVRKQDDFSFIESIL